MATSKMKPKTHVAIILDRSGSMYGTRDATIRGYNEQVQQMKSNSREQDITCSLLTFNGAVFEHLWMEPVDKLKEADPVSYMPEGSTALWDAMGYTVQKLLDTTDSNDENTSYLLIVISDGEENASSHCTVNAVRELLDSVQKTNRWTITYMGCSEDSVRRVAKATNIPVGNVAVWSNTSEEKTAGGMRLSAKAMGGYYENRLRSGPSGQSCSALYGTDTSVADFASDVASTGLAVMSQSSGDRDFKVFQAIKPVIWQTTK